VGSFSHTGTVIAGQGASLPAENTGEVIASGSANHPPMATQLQKIKGIIHTAAAAAAGIGAGLAQVPGSDAPALVGIQTTMIMMIADAHRMALTKAAAADFLLTFTATMAGRGLSGLLVGWIPGLGNAINAATAAGLTEAVGWAAHAYFTPDAPALPAPAPGDSPPEVC
jgi:uncharacterized protein (DUF697 family)